MPWLRLALITNGDRAEGVAETLEARGALSVSLEDAGDEPRLAVADEATPLWSNVRVVALFPTNTPVAELIESLNAELGTESGAWQHDIIADQDWERAWMERFAPIHFGGALWICPSWQQAPDPAAINIYLDPGLAFGSGTHATTAMILAWLARHAPIGKTVLDFGCGSGILAIAALKLGAHHADGVDVDAQALDTSRANAERNGVSDRLSLSHPKDLPEGLVVDLVLANILAQPLIDLAPRLRAHTAPDGFLVLSGMLSAQIDEVSKHYMPAFDFEIETRDEWAMLIGRRAAD